MGWRRRNTRRYFGTALLAALLLAGAPPARAAVPAHGRAWELVTNGPTNGVLLGGARAWGGDGDTIVFVTLGPIPGALAGDLLAHALARRTASGWTQQPLGEPYEIGLPDVQSTLPLAIGDDMASSVWSSAVPLLPGAPGPPDAGLYLRHPDGGLQLLGSVGERSSFTFAGASGDLRRVVFQSPSHLLPADAGRTSGADVYELDGTNLQLVAVDSGGTALSTCGSQVGNGDAQSDTLLHAISPDGTRIFLSAPPSGSCGVPQRVYLRENDTQTIEVSASACTRADCNAPQDVSFAGATPDSSSVFLTTAQQLTNDDTDASVDLYRYDVAAHALTRLSAGPPGVAADVSSSIVRASDDGLRVYFLASGALVPGEGVPGGSNLYLSDHGRLRFVATADGVDLRTAQLTADGRILTFATATPLLPSDIDASADVYRYDATTGTLQQVSLGRGGAGNGAFDVEFGTQSILASMQQSWMPWMSADGSRVFFFTSEPLVPEDVNQTPDVYEWANGDVGLVSSGTGDGTVRYAGASADGRSVFFFTDETLVPFDRNDGDEDLYDARLGGGFPAPPPAPPACEGDACQGPPAAPLAPLVPATLSATGSGPAPRVLRIVAPDRRARRALARSGRATIVIDVPAAGRVALIATARIHRRTTVVARVAATARGAGRLRLVLRLTAAARHVLRREGVLRLRLVARLPGHGAAPPLLLTLRRSR
jgi:hypothetical protein